MRSVSPRGDKTSKESEMNCESLKQRAIELTHESSEEEDVVSGGRTRGQSVVRESSSETLSASLLIL